MRRGVITRMCASSQTAIAEVLRYSLCQRVLYICWRYIIKVWVTRLVPWLATVRIIRVPADCVGSPFSTRIIWSPSVDIIWIFGIEYVLQLFCLVQIKLFLGLKGIYEYRNGLNIEFELFTNSI